MNKGIVQLDKRDLVLGICCLLLFLGLIYQGLIITPPESKKVWQHN